MQLRVECVEFLATAITYANDVPGGDGWMVVKGVQFYKLRNAKSIKLFGMCTQLSIKGVLWAS